MLLRPESRCETLYLLLISIRISTLPKDKSASKSSTFLCEAAIQMARFTAMLVFPTPPLPLVTTKVPAWRL
jgi:hypothetical protein